MTSRSRDANDSAATDDAAPDLDRLRRELAALVQQIGALAQHGSADARKAAERLGADARRAFDAAQDQGRNRIDTARADLESHVHKSPLQSVLMAFGLGFIVALLVRR